MYMHIGLPQREVYFYRYGEEHGRVAEIGERVRIFKQQAEYGGTVAATMGFPGFVGQTRALLAIRRLTAIQRVEAFGGYLLPGSSIGLMAGGYLYDKLSKSRGQDRKSGTSVSPVLPKTPRGTKPSRRASPGKTSKPFWANGKPKCKKGFRYDFKRKLCVKIK